MAAKKTTSSAGTKKTSKKTSSSSKKVTPETGRWNGHKFTVSPSLIRGFSGLQIEGSCKTEEKKKSNQHYAARKNGNPTEVNITAHLNAFTGCDVRKEALAFVSEASAGKSDYFYIGNKKLVTYKLLLQKATVKEVEIAHNHTWVRADVQLTFEQTGVGGTSVSTSSKSSSSSSGSYSSTGSQKQSVKTSSTTTSSSGTSLAQKILTTAKTVVNKAATVTKRLVTNALSGGSSTSSTASVVTPATAAIKKIVSAAKAYTAAKKQS